MECMGGDQQPKNPAAMALNCAPAPWAGIRAGMGFRSQAELLNPDRVAGESRENSHWAWGEEQTT